MMNKKLDTAFVSFEIEKGILIASYKPNARITLKDAKEIVASRMAFIEGKPMPTLILNHGIVKMDKKKFMFYNIVGCIAWAVTMLFAGHYLNAFIKSKYNFDLKEHLEVIVIGIVLITTLPVIWKLFFSKKKNLPKD